MTKYRLHQWSCILHKMVVHTFYTTLSDLIWTAINWTMEVLAFILMSVQIKSVCLRSVQVKVRWILLQNYSIANSCLGYYGHSTDKAGRSAPDRPPTDRRPTDLRSTSDRPPTGARPAPDRRPTDLRPTSDQPPTNLRPTSDRRSPTADRPPTDRPPTDQPCLGYDPFGFLMGFSKEVKIWG